ncbi:MAG TPA: hypothetical protein VGB91_16910 [Rhizomicrobium sp.]
MSRRLVLALALVFVVQPAFAAEKAGDPGTNVDMPFLIAPMSRDGKLLGYSYISSKLVASSQRAALEIRDRIAFIQDAFVRDVNAAPVSKADDPTAVDPGLLAARLVADARQVVGTAKVARMIFGDGKKEAGITFAPLHPTQVPAAPDQPGQAAGPPPAGAAAAR